MVVVYKGFEIDVKREECMAGYDLIYRNAVRLSDGYLFWGDFSDDADTVRTHVQMIKNRIDDYLANPQDYEED